MLSRGSFVISCNHSYFTANLNGSKQSQTSSLIRLPMPILKYQNLNKTVVTRYYK